MFNFYLELKAQRLLRERDNHYLKEWVRLLGQELQVNAGNYIFNEDLTIKNSILLIQDLEGIIK